MIEWQQKVLITINDKYVYLVFYCYKYYYITVIYNNSNTCDYE